MQPEPSPANPTNRVRSRRRLKSALFFFFALAVVAAPSETLAFSAGDRSGLSRRRSEWISRSVEYYSTVMRKNGASRPQKKTRVDSTPAVSEVPLATNGRGTGNEVVADRHDKDFVRLATNHYYARFLIKEGKWTFAEKIYRRIIAELSEERRRDGGDCDRAKLAVSTLLLALHLQRMADVEAARAVFLDFFRRAAARDDEARKCSCSAKVLQAYALFEMKNGRSAESLEIVRRAVRMDEALRPVLGWKQFRDAAAGREYVPRLGFRKGGGEAERGDLAP